MNLPDLATHNRKNLKVQDALSIARSCQKHLSHLASMGYAAGAQVEGERAVVIVTTPQGRRFEVAVREIGITEEIEKSTAFGVAMKVIQATRDLPPISAGPIEGPVAEIAYKTRNGQTAELTGKAQRILAAQAAIAKTEIDGEYVYRNYAVSHDGRTWETLTAEERLSWDDRARRLAASLESSH